MVAVGTPAPAEAGRLDAEKKRQINSLLREAFEPGVWYPFAKVAKYLTEHGIRSAEPVSYTHLDVYKRQTLGQLTIFFSYLGQMMWPIRQLDVYKRQGLRPSSAVFAPSTCWVCSSWNWLV